MDLRKICFAIEMVISVIIDSWLRFRLSALSKFFLKPSQCKISWNTKQDLAYFRLLLKVAISSCFCLLHTNFLIVFLRVPFLIVFPIKNTKKKFQLRNKMRVLLFSAHITGEEILIRVAFFSTNSAKSPLYYSI